MHELDVHVVVLVQPRRAARGGRDVDRARLTQPEAEAGLAAAAWA